MKTLTCTTRALFLPALALVTSVDALTPSALAEDRAADTLTARGHVFLDRDADGERDAGEPGVAGVAVSNGVDVVRTDRDGGWEIAAPDDCQIFVCKPRDHQVPLDEDNKPRFWRTHKPSGSPDENFNFEGFEPTGPLPGRIDFPLTHSPEPDRFDVIVFGDPQPYDKEQVRLYAKDVMSDVLQHGFHERAAFGISLGDLVGDDLDLFHDIDDVQATAGIPWRNVYGNHDVNFMSPTDEHADETFERVYGPPTHAFQHGPVHFIVVDNVIWQGFDGYRDSGFPKTGNYRGGLRDDQLTCIENYLRDVETDALIVLAMHIPLEGGGVHRVPEQRRLFEILSRFPNTLSLSGHTHFQRHWFFDSTDGYTAGTEHHHFNAATASGSWYRGAPDEYAMPHTTMRCGAPNGYNVFTFDGNTYSARFKGAREPLAAQMHAWVPEDAAAGDEIVVNVWAGSERDLVRFRIDDGPWRTMRHEVRHDPYLVRIKELEESDEPPRGRTTPDLTDSHHIWVGRLPNDLAPGVRTLEVVARDLYAQTHRLRRTIHVGESGGR